MEIDLSTRMCLSPRAYSRSVGEGNVVHYCPDSVGWPFVLRNAAQELIEQFRSERSIGEAIAATTDAEGFPAAVDAIQRCAQRGLLVTDARTRTYVASPIGQTRSRAMSVWLHVNNACNLDCSYCFVDKDERHLDDATAASVVELLARTAESRSLRVMQIKFAGGEPTMKLASIVRFCELLEARVAGLDVDVQYALLTNGTICTPALLEFIDRRRVAVAISLDGYGESHHDLHRIYKGTGVGSWQTIQRTIDRLEPMDISISINGTISQESCDSLPDLCEWAVDKGFPIRVGIVRPTLEYDVQRGMSFAGVPDDGYRRICDRFEETFARLESPDVELDVGEQIRICELNFYRPSTALCCGAGSNHIVIGQDGRLSSCPMTVSEGGIDERSDAFDGARRTVSHWDSTVRNRRVEAGDPDNCLACRWYPVCTGGCPVTNERLFGDPFQVSPMHPFYQYVIPRFVDFYGRKLVQAAARVGFDGPILHND